MTPGHHSVTMVIPLAMIMAELGVDPWWTPLANLGIAGAVIGWFMWRDKVDRQDRKEEREEQERRRKEEREEQERRHRENLTSIAEVKSALRVHMELTIVGMRAVQTMDKGYADLLEQFGKQNHEPK